MVVKLMRNCYRSATRHPFLLFMICVLYWIYRSFPVLFSILVHVAPVIASTLVLLGTLLFYGHANESQFQKEAKSYHHDVDLVFGGMGNAVIDDESYLVDDDHKFTQEAKSDLGNRKLVLVNRYGQFQQIDTRNTKLKSRDVSRRNSIDPLQSVLGHIEDYDDDDDDKGWDTGSDVVGSSSPSASVADIIQMINEHQPLDSDVALESGEMINETDDDVDDDDDDHNDDDHEGMLVRDFDEDEPYITWTEDDQRNLMNLGTLELERNQRLESLIARQKAIKNMRIMAEKNIANACPDVHFIDAHVLNANNIPFDHQNLPHENTFGSDSSNMMPRRYSFDLPYDPRVPERIFSDIESIGSIHASDINEHMISRNRFSEDDDIVKVNEVAKGDERSNEVKTSGYEDKTSDNSSSLSFVDVTDGGGDVGDGDGDDVEEENNSEDDDDSSSSSTSGSEDEDSEDSDAEDVGIAQRLKSWFTSW